MIVAVCFVVEDIHILEFAVFLLNSSLTGNVAIHFDIGSVDDTHILHEESVLSGIGAAVLDVANCQLIGTGLQRDPGIASFPLLFGAVTGDLVDVLAIDNDVDSVVGILGGDQVIESNCLTSLQLHIGIQDGEGAVDLAVGRLDAADTLILNGNEGPGVLSGLAIGLLICGIVSDIDVTLVDGACDHIAAGELIGGLHNRNHVLVLGDQLLIVVLCGEVSEDLVPSVFAGDCTGVCHCDHTVTVDDHGHRPAVTAEADLTNHIDQAHGEIQFQIGLPAHNIVDSLTQVIVQSEDLHLIGEVCVCAVDSGEFLFAPGAAAIPEVQHNHLLLCQGLGQRGGVIVITLQGGAAADLATNLHDFLGVDGIQLTTLVTYQGGIVGDGEIIHNVTQLETLAAGQLLIGDQRGSQGDGAGIAGKGIVVLLGITLGNTGQRYHIVLASLELEGHGAIGAGTAGLDQVLQGLVLIDHNIDILHRHTACSLDADDIIGSVAAVIIASGRTRTGGAAGICCRATSHHGKGHDDCQNKCQHLCHFFHSFSPVRFVILKLKMASPFAHFPKYHTIVLQYPSTKKSLLRTLFTVS